MHQPVIRSVVVVVALAVSLAAARQPLTSPVYYLTTAAQLLDGVPVSGELTRESGQNFKDGSRLEVYVVPSGGRETVDLRVESDDFEPVLTLVAPNGQVVASNDFAIAVAAMHAARVRAYLDEPGTYVVVVSGYGPLDLGRYTVARSRFVQPPKVVVDLDVPGRRDGYLAELAADTVWIDLREQTTLVARLRSDEFDTVLELYDGAGRFVAANDDHDGTNSRLVVELEPGRYEFLLKAYWDESSGAYTFDVEPYEAPPVVIVDVERPARYAGYLNAEAVDTYLLRLDAPATVTIDLRSEAFDAFLEVFDVDGIWIDTNDDFDGTDARLILELGAGAYRIEASGYWFSDEGPYTIDVRW